jgi:uncharacterized protein YjbJ (UPF0337 family)
MYAYVVTFVLILVDGN